MDNYTLYSYLVAVVIIIAFFAFFEIRKPEIRDVMPIVIICIVASVGRVLFSYIPQVQPATALIIITGVCLGKTSGFMTGALTAIVSNMALGQGPWTIWQILAWGIIGFLAGCFRSKKTDDLAISLESKPSKNVIKFVTICIYAFLSAFMFSVIMDVWTISTLGESLTINSAFGIFLTGIVFNIPHAIMNVVFVALLYKPLDKIFLRLRVKFGIH